MEIHTLLVKADTIIYLAVCIGLFLGESPMLKYFYRRLREFESDALRYEEEHMRPNSDFMALGTHERRDHECQEDSTVYTSILPPLANIV